MKKIILLFAITFIASFYYVSAQNLMPHNQKLTSIRMGKPLEHPATAKEYQELTYINGPLVSVIGTSILGTNYVSGCISFTATQMLPYVKKSIDKIKVAIPPIQFVPNLSMEATAWIKESLNGTILHQQEFVPIPGDYNEVVFTEPYFIPESSSLVMGFTIKLENVSGGSTRPWWCSSKEEDPYIVGGFNYLFTANPDGHGVGANWSQFTIAGNLGIIGFILCEGPFNDLAAISVIDPDPEEFKLQDEEYTYLVTVNNMGAEDQDNYIVQLIDETDLVLSSKTITKKIVSGSSITVNLSYASPVADNLTIRGKVILEGDEVPENDISEPTVVVIHPDVGINEATKMDNIMIFPNPTMGELTIKNEELTIKSIEIFDVYGKKLLSYHLITSSSHHSDISNLQAGIYFVKITTVKGIVTKKTIKY